MRTARKKQIIVFAVNIDSPSRHQVSMGNSINPVDEPINLADQTEPVSSAIIFQAYQKAIDVGSPIRTADTKGLPFHQSDKNCAFM
tara:strand:- start:20182 stop:20439 length:258 start_codon:yes stop_codon:yes gene_type:complete